MTWPIRAAAFGGLLLAAAGIGPGRESADQAEAELPDPMLRFETTGHKVVIHEISPSAATVRD